MDGLNSFYDSLDGLEKLVNEDSVALIAGMAILSIFVRNSKGWCMYNVRSLRS